MTNNCDFHVLLLIFKYKFIKYINFMQISPWKQ